MDEQRWRKRQKKQHVVPPPSSAKAAASIQWEEGSKVKVLIPTGRLTAVEESQRLEVKGWSSLLWPASCWETRLKRWIYHVGEDVTLALIGGWGWRDHSNGLRRFKQKFKKYVITWDLTHINIGPVGQTKPGRNLREHLQNQMQVSHQQDKFRRLESGRKPLSNAV